MYETLIKKKKGAKIRLCFRDKVVVFESPKTLYNHSHRKGKPCADRYHMTVTLKNFDDIVGMLEEMGVLQSGALHIRKQRKDNGARHRVTTPRSRRRNSVSSTTMSQDMPNSLSDLSFPMQEHDHFPTNFEDAIQRLHMMDQDSTDPTLPTYNAESLRQDPSLLQDQ